MILPHLFRQGAVARSLLHAAGRALTQTAPKALSAGNTSAIRQRIEPRHRQLIADYVRHVGGDRRTYQRTLPPHFFPQWLVPLQGELLSSLPYPMHRVLNAGGRFLLSEPLPAQQSLEASAQIDTIDDDGRRARITLRCTTGPRTDPERLIAFLDLYVPLAETGRSEHDVKQATQKQRKAYLVPSHARELHRYRFRPRGARRFVALTGDINPIHWLPAAARAAGFRNVIQHGYSTMAQAYETILRGVFAGQPSAMQEFSFQFTRPLVLPASPKLFVDRPTRRYWLADGIGCKAYSLGSY